MRDIVENEICGGTVSGQWKISDPAIGSRYIGVERSIGTSYSKTVIHGHISMSLGPCQHPRPIGIESLLCISHECSQNLVNCQPASRPRNH